MRSTRLMITSGGALLVIVLVGSGCAQQEVEAPTHVDWPMYRGDLGGSGYSPLTPDHYGQRGEPDSGLELLAAE